MKVLFLVRHAKAADRARFGDEDLERPLTRKGREQATLLAELLAAEQPVPSRLLSSPAVRCLETVSPFAERVGLAIEEAGYLQEGAVATDAVSALVALGDEAVVACSHGDVIWGVLEWLAGAGVDLGRRPDAPKGGTWVVRFGSSGEPASAELKALPAPARSS